MQCQYVPCPDQSSTRDYPATLGRWMTPDALGGDVSNPQSLNRYAYALNNPTTNTDPTGTTSLHCGSIPCGMGSAVYIGQSMEGYLANGGTFSPIGPPGSGDNPGGDANAAAFAQYLVGNNLCPGGCAGTSYTQRGVTYTWVPGTYSQSDDVISVTTGYWSMSGPDGLGLVGQLQWYINGALGALQNWMAKQLTPPPGVNIDIIPLQLIHSPEVIEGNADFANLSNLTNEELIDSLAPGADEPLTVGPAGQVFQGNTRIYILQQRGFDVNSLPRTDYTPSPLDGVPQ
jgi:hypothetical protein